MRNDLKRNLTDDGRYIAQDADEAGVYQSMGLDYVLASDLEPAVPTRAEKFNAAVQGMAQAVAERERKKATQAAENERAAQRAELTRLQREHAALKRKQAERRALLESMEGNRPAAWHRYDTAATDWREAQYAAAAAKKSGDWTTQQAKESEARDFENAVTAAEQELRRLGVSRSEVIQRGRQIHTDLAVQHGYLPRN
jgi:hypothetical protein